MYAVVPDDQWSRELVSLRWLHHIDGVLLWQPHNGIEHFASLVDGPEATLLERGHHCSETITRADIEAIVLRRNTLLEQIEHAFDDITHPGEVLDPDTVPYTDSEADAVAYFGSRTQDLIPSAVTDGEDRLRGYLNDAFMLSTRAYAHFLPAFMRLTLSIDGEPDPPSFDADHVENKLLGNLSRCGRNRTLEIRGFLSTQQRRLVKEYLDVRWLIGGQTSIERMEREFSRGLWLWSDEAGVPTANVVDDTGVPSERKELLASIRAVFSEVSVPVEIVADLRGPYRDDEAALSEFLNSTRREDITWETLAAACRKHLGWMLVDLTPEGFAHFFPAFARVSIDSYLDSDSFTEDLWDHLTGAWLAAPPGRTRNLAALLTDEQRAAVLRYLEFVHRAHSRDVFIYRSDHLAQARELLVPTGSQ